MKKSILFWLTFALALLIALYFAVRISMTIMGMGTVSRSSSISVKSDFGTAMADEVAATMQLPVGRSVYTIDMEKLLEKMSNLPDIKDAGIRRTPSGKILVRVTARKIVASWTDGTNFYPLAADGQPIGRMLDARPKNTFVFTGVLPTDLGPITEALRTNARISKNLDHIEWIEGRRWNLYTFSGTKIMLPENKVDAALGKLAHLQKQNNILDRSLSVIDMRDPDRTLVVISR